MECKICNKDYKTKNSLSTHVKVFHKKSFEEYYLEFIGTKDGCLNCKQPTTFFGYNGYAKFCCRKCASHGEFNPRFGKQNSEDQKQKQSDMMKLNNPMKDKETADRVNAKQRGVKRNYSPEHLDNIRAHIKRLNERGFENKGGNTRFYKYNDRVIQGRYELYFLMNNSHLTKPSQIKTPFGVYTPDFEDEEFFYEIKSTFTIKRCVKSKQIDKIKFVNSTIKKVKIKVLKESEVHEFLRNLNIKQYEYNI